MKYYWCVNCGYNGNFGFYRQKIVECQFCNYKDLAELDEQEYNEWAAKYKKIQDNDVFYKNKDKV